MTSPAPKVRYVETIQTVRGKEQSAVVVIGGHDVAELWCGPYKHPARLLELAVTCRPRSARQRSNGRAGPRSRRERVRAERERDGRSAPLAELTGNLNGLHENISDRSEQYVYRLGIARRA